MDTISMTDISAPQLGQLQAFIEVARRGTISRAAEALFVSQPALTARIQGLERTLGSSLFARGQHGSRLTETALELCRRFGIETAVLPMTDERVRTRFDTDGGVLSFQEYFVRERLVPALRRIDFEGIDSAKPTPEAEAALAEADVVVIGPSNPLISIAPILRVLGSHVHRDRTVAISPIVGGVALKGPTVAMMRAMGLEASPSAVAKMYAGAASAFIVDTRDAALAPAVEALGCRAIVSDTVMTDGGRGLAAAILAASPVQQR